MKKLIGLILLFVTNEDILQFPKNLSNLTWKSIKIYLAVLFLEVAYFKRFMDAFMKLLELEKQS
jgi:hypothetical protein